jgi:uncharacterized membrane protein YccF (DUF307 family)
LAGVAYGPALYQITGFALWLFGPSIGTSKIPGLTAFALSQLLSFATLWRAGLRVVEALMMTSVQCVLQAGFTDQAHVSGVRSDALLFLAAQTAVLAATYAPSMLMAGALGLLGGVAANLKIHGALYILPAFAYSVRQSSGTAAGLRLSCVAALAGAVALAAPFIPDNVSLLEYYHYFQAVRHRQWLPWLFEQNIVFEAMCLAPLLSIYALCKPRFPRAFSWWMATLVVCMTFVTIPAAENGAGPHHLLPFLPSVIWGFAVMGREVSASLPDSRARGRYEGLSVGLIAAILFGYGPIVITSWSRISHIFADTPLVSEAAAEIDKALAENPGLKVAVGSGAVSFDAEALRVIPVFRGNPMPIDSTSWMTSEADGVSNEVVRRAITECRVDLWLLPSVAPFVVISHLDGKNIFSPEVLADFHATYTKQISGRIFDQWRCKRDDDGSGKKT